MSIMLVQCVTRGAVAVVIHLAPWECLRLGSVFSPTTQTPQYCPRKTSSAVLSTPKDVKEVMFIAIFNCINIKLHFEFSLKLFLMGKEILWICHFPDIIINRIKH